MGQSTAIRGSAGRAAGLDATSLALRPVKKPLHQPQHVGRAENHAQRGGNGPAAAYVR